MVKAGILISLLSKSKIAFAEFFFFFKEIEESFQK